MRGRIILEKKWIKSDLSDKSRSIVFYSALHQNNGAPDTFLSKSRFTSPERNYIFKFAWKIYVFNSFAKIGLL